MRLATLLLTYLLTYLFSDPGNKDELLLYLLCVLGQSRLLCTFFIGCCRPSYVINVHREKSFLLQFMTACVDVKSSLSDVLTAEAKRSAVK